MEKDNNKSKIIIFSLLLVMFIGISVVAIIENFNKEDEPIIINNEIKGYKVFTQNKELNGSNNTITLAYNLSNKTNEEGVAIDALEYQFYLNNMKIENASGYYYYDDLNDIDINDFNDIKTIKDNNNKDYLVIILDTPEPTGDASNNIFIIDDSGKLLSSLFIANETGISKLTGDNSNNYLYDEEENVKNYSQYSILSNCITYLEAPDYIGERSECDFTEIKISIENGNIIKSELGKLHGTGFSGAAGDFTTILTTY